MKLSMPLWGYGLLILATMVALSGHLVKEYCVGEMQKEICALCRENNQLEMSKYRLIEDNAILKEENTRLRQMSSDNKPNSIPYSGYAIPSASTELLPLLIPGLLTGRVF